MYYQSEKKHVVLKQAGKDPKGCARWVTFGVGVGVSFFFQRGVHMKNFKNFSFILLIALVVIVTANIIVSKIPLAEESTRCSDLVFNLKQGEIRHTTGEGVNVSCYITKTGK